jgi:uncharacterized small protein (DUF1192 family)
MISDDDLNPTKPHRGVRDLSPLSVAELDDYILALQAETIRAQDARTRKQAYTQTASSFFKKE